ncbi:MAG: hypothetical protein HQL07_08260 [Nitrospirae bacterium]|nr:hypothetical protein [Magnetococcales bacterium]
MKRFMGPGGWSVGFVMLVLMVLPLHMAWGLTLGALEIRSHLGEPFDATVAIALGEKEAAIAVGAAKATPEDYQPLHLEYHEVISTLLLDLQGQGSQRRLVITSKAPVNVPFFNFLLKLSTGQGDHFRNYPIFLEVRPSTLSTYFPPAMQPLRPPAITPTDQDRGEYGPVRPGETLLGIADQFVIPPYHRYQMLAAFYALNKTLLVGGNMNGLPVGVILKVPSLGHMGALSVDQAQALVAAQRRDWMDGESKGRVVSTRPKIPTGSTPSNTLQGDGLRKTDSDIPKTPSKNSPTPPAKDVPAKDVIDMRLTVSPSEKDDSLASAHRMADTQSAQGDNTAQAAPQAGDKTKPNQPDSVPSEAVLALKADVAKPPGVPEATPAPPLELKSSGWQDGMVEVDSLKKDVTKLTEQLKQSEASRTHLQLQMVALEARFKKLEQDQNRKVPEVAAPFPWESLVIGGIIVALVTGILAWLSFRRRQNVWSAPAAIPAEPMVVADSHGNPTNFEQIRRVPDEGTTVVQAGLSGVSSGILGTFSADPPAVPDQTPVDEPFQPSRPLPERVSWETEAGSQTVVENAMAAISDKPVLAAAVVAADDDRDAGILDLGGEDDADNIFNLADDHQSPSGAAVTQAKDDSAGVFDLGNEEEVDIPSQDEAKSTVLMEIGQEDGGGLGHASVMAAVGNGSPSLLNGEETVEITQVGGTSTSQDYETIVFELPSQSELKDEGSSPKARPIEVETVAFDHSTPKEMVVKKSEEKPTKGSVSPLKSNENSSARAVEDDSDGDLLELELITEE